MHPAILPPLIAIGLGLGLGPGGVGSTSNPGKPMPIQAVLQHHQTSSIIAVDQTEKRLTPDAREDLEVSIQRRNGRIYLIQKQSRPSSNGAPARKNVIRYDIFRPEHLPAKPIALVDGGTLRFRSGTSHAQTTGKRPRVEVVCYTAIRDRTPFQTLALTEQKIVIGDFHMEWSGGSGGTLTQAWIQDGSIWVSENHVQNFWIGEDTYVIPLEGFEREELELHSHYVFRMK